MTRTPTPPDGGSEKRARAREENRALWREAKQLAKQLGRPTQAVFKELQSKSAQEWREAEYQRSMAELEAARREIQAIVDRLPSRLVPVELGGEWHMPEDRDEILDKLIAELGGDYGFASSP